MMRERMKAAGPVTVLLLALIAATSCLETETGNGSVEVAQGQDRVAASVESDIGGKQTMATEADANMEGRMIQVEDGTSIRIISVTTAVSETKKHVGMAAIEGSVSYPADVSDGFVINCISRVLWIADARVRAQSETFQGQVPDDGDRVVVIGELTETAGDPVIAVSSILKEGKALP